MVGDREVHRKEVERLISSQNRDVAVADERCHVDGKPCLTPERQVVWRYGFGWQRGD